MSETKAVGSAGDAVILGPGGGRVLHAAGNRQWVRIEPSTGARGFSLMEVEVPPDGQVFPHRHSAFEEAFYVLEGLMEFLVGDEVVEVAAGGSVYIPTDVVHAFRNRSTAPVRMLVIHSPARAIEMIEELSGMARPDPAAIAGVMARHQSATVRVDDWAPARL